MNLKETMREMMKFFVLLAVPALCFANGGPVDGSNILATGGMAPLGVPDVALVSEELTFTPDGDWMDVQAVYTLHNTGPAVSLDYAFPVEYAGLMTDYGESAWVPSELPTFRMTADGRALDVSILDDPEGFTVEIEELGETMQGLRKWYTSTLELSAGETVVLCVQYRCRANFMDWLTSKSFYESFSERSFRYDLDPAGRWGDGTVGDFRFMLDLRQVMRYGDAAVIVPEGGEWSSDSIYEIHAVDLQLAGAGPLTVTWNSDIRNSSEYIAARRIPADLITAVTASSILPDQGGCSYSPWNMFDMDLTTAWAEGVPGPGIGEWVEVSLSGFGVMEIAIVGGYAKNGESYRANARPAEVEYEVVEESGRTTGTVELTDLAWREADRSTFSPLVGSVVFLGDCARPVRSIRLRVLDVHPGSSFDDLCISELLILGVPDGESGTW